MRNYRVNPKQAAAISVVIFLALLTKAPFFLMIALVFVIATTTHLATGRPKREVTRGEKPKVVKIAGVGEVEWITDPRQLEAGRLLSVKDLKKLESEVLCSPSEWIEQGERVATSEDEVASKPEPPPYKQGTSHTVLCRCQKCAENKKTRHGHSKAIEPACHECYKEWRVAYGEKTAMLLAQKAQVVEMVEELTVEDRARPVAYYARGGIIKPPAPPLNPKNPIPHYRPRLVDRLERRWM